MSNLFDDAVNAYEPFAEGDRDLDMYGKGKIVLGSGTDQTVVEVKFEDHYVTDNDTGNVGAYYAVSMVNDGFEFAATDLIGPEEPVSERQALRNLLAILYTCKPGDFPPEVAVWGVRNLAELERTIRTLDAA